MVSIINLKKNYKGYTAVDIEQLTISPTESFGLVGNNGAGKTTLFRMILDLVRPNEGEIQINGRNVQGNDEWKMYVGSYLDENFLIPYLTPEEYFQFVGKLHRYKKDDLQAFRLQLLNELKALFFPSMQSEKKEWLRSREIRKRN